MVEVPFTDAEKRFVLAEALKASQVSLDALISLVQSNEFSLGDMLLPGGRTPNECLAMLNELVPGGAQTRSSLESPAFISQRRQLSAPEGASLTARRIQPRPASHGGESTIIQQQPIIGAVPGKKRGRPSKAELEARAARGEIPTPRTPKRKSFSGGGAPIAALLSAEPSSAPPLGQSSTMDMESEDQAKKKPKRGRPSKADLLAKQGLHSTSEQMTTPTQLPMQPRPLVQQRHDLPAIAQREPQYDPKPSTTNPHPPSSRPAATQETQNLAPPT